MIAHVCMWSRLVFSDPQSQGPSEIAMTKGEFVLCRHGVRHVFNSGAVK